MIPISDATLPQSRGLQARKVPARGIVIHTPGRAFTARACQITHDAAWPVTEEAALRWYVTSGFAFYGGYMVGPSGAVYRLADDRTRTQHAGALDARYTERGGREWRAWAKPLAGHGWVKHERDPAQVFDWWDARWPGLKSPTELMGPFPNDAIGIDIMPMLDGSYSMPQVRALAALVRDLCQLHGLPHDRRHVVGHEDVDPCSRGTVLRSGRVIGTPWDPSPALDWKALDLGGAP